MSPAILATGIPTLGDPKGRPARASADGSGGPASSNALGGDVHVIEEGMRGRRTVFDDPHEEGRNGLTHLPVALHSHAPLDLVLISLGTNDPFVPGVNAFHAACGARGVALDPVANGDGHRGR